MTGPSDASTQPEVAATPSAVPTLPGDAERTLLPERVVNYWRVSSALPGIPTTLVVTLIAWAATGSAAVGGAVFAVLGLALLIDVVFIAPRRRALWWYAIGSEQIDLQSGWLIIRRTVIPMTRVQHVQLERGPVADRFRLAELKIFTAAGFVRIPALDRDEGDRIRQQIAELARIADDL